MSAGASGPILLFAEDPGAVNCIAPLVEALRARSAHTLLLSDGHATALLAARGLDPRPIDDPAHAKQAVTASGAQRVVVGTSENPQSCGFALIAAAREAGIDTIGVVDFASNAAFRFRGAGNDPLAFAPDRLLVPDEWTASEYVLLGVDRSRISVVGHPQYDHALRRRDELEREGRDAVRRRLLPAALPDALVAVFVSEISTGLDPQQYTRSHEYTLSGRAQARDRTVVVLEELLDALAVHRRAKRVYLVLRKHPKETHELRAYEPELDAISQGGDALELIFAADLVIGMSSMLMIEADLLGVPTLSIVPRERERAWLPTVRSGVTPCVADREAVRTWLAANLQPRDARQTDAALKRRGTHAAGGAVERMANVVMSERPTLQP